MVSEIIVAELRSKLNKGKHKIINVYLLYSKKFTFFKKINKESYFEKLWNKCLNVPH